MRRHDRETSYRDAVAILQGCRYVTIAFHGGEYPYAVPMHFGLTEEAGALTLWFHGADEGKKLDLLRRDARVAFSAVRFCKDVPPLGEIACTATARFESVFGEGELFIAAECEKERGLRALLSHGGMTGTLPPAALARVCVLKLRVDTLSVKRHE